MLLLTRTAHLSTQELRQPSARGPRRVQVRALVVGLGETWCDCEPVRLRHAACRRWPGWAGGMRGWSTSSLTQAPCYHMIPHHLFAQAWPCVHRACVLHHTCAPPPPAARCPRPELLKACAPVSRHGVFYDFVRNNRAVHSSIVHFQVRLGVGAQGVGGDVLVVPEG